MYISIVPYNKIFVIITRLCGCLVCVCTARRFIFVKCSLPEQIGAQVSTEFIFEKEKQTKKKSHCFGF